MPVLVVRHAVAVPARSWAGDDVDRPLDERGERQAGALVGQLAAFRVVRVLASPAVRCVETVAPLAGAGGLVVEPEEGLFEGNAQRAAELVHRFLGPSAGAAPPGGIVLCSHGDVIPDVLGQLERDGADLGDDRRCKKGSTWVLERGPDGAVNGLYLPPPA